MTTFNDENINQYFSRVTNIVNQMRIYEEDVKEERIVSKVLSTITKKYDTHVSNVECIGTDWFI